MARQIIKQPDGKFAIWSSTADGIIMHGATRSQIERFFVLEAEKETIRSVGTILDLVDGGHAQDAYFQFAKPWEEALRQHNENHPADAIEGPRR